MKKEIWLGIAFLTLVTGSMIGYFFGYNIGFEKAVKTNTTETGKTFTQDIGNEPELSDLIVVENPQPNQYIESPVLIEGQAKGYWYFEASFPVELVGDNGKFLGEGAAQAKGDWMTEEFVPFSLELFFIKPSSQKGNLILRNDNPSGLPENTKELRIPISFEE